MLQTRKEQLVKVMDEHDAKLSAEQNTYTKFLSHCKGHIKNSLDVGQLPDLTKLKHYWKEDFVGNNGLKEKDVKSILFLVKKNSFSFNQFKDIRRGNFEAIK